MRKVPSIWKEVKVTTIHKKNDPSDAANYRPIPHLGDFFPKNRFFFIFLYSVVHHIISKITQNKENLPSSSKVTALHYMAYVGFFTQLFVNSLRQVKYSVTQFYI